MGKGSSEEETKATRDSQSGLRETAHGNKGGNEKMSRSRGMSVKRQRIEEHRVKARRREQGATPPDPVSGGFQAFSPQGANSHLQLETRTSTSKPVTRPTFGW